MDNRDELTKSLFNSDVKVVYSGSDVFEGLYFDAPIVAQVTGAMDGSVIDVRVTATSTAFSICHPFLARKAQCLIRSEKGRIWMENRDLCLNVENQKHGLGARIFARQVLGAKALNIKRIVMPAAGSIQTPSHMESELAWLKFGFIANLPFDIRADLGVKGHPFSHVKTLQDLIAVPGGTQWWIENGHPFRMEFDTSDNSFSWSVLMAYLNRKNIAL
ncbi:hypothetical protein FNU76_00355 [Chitinimonas arctica]|uniref:Uncharacterized protein n=1 Tax=Chitinimonas arctica TaxID=2594795 RepID=A0A516SA40_9NEIS|nr:hypothetical protein [Chitinimonas arctica]QDQ24918.1 hypothetical protein FNU76_00355 [Chitinimonas arctica]